MRLLKLIIAIIMISLLVVICKADIVGMYMTAPIAMNAYISPEDMCSGKLCRFRVRQVIRKGKLYEHKLKQLDKIERRLNKEAERDMLDLNSLQNVHDHRVLQHKLRKEQRTLRKVKLTRVKLMALLRKILSDFSYSQQARIIRYIGLEHRIDPSYENLTKNNGLQRMKVHLI